MSMRLRSAWSKWKRDNPKSYRRFKSWEARSRKKYKEEMEHLVHLDRKSA